jgi:hypothetical protein
MMSKYRINHDIMRGMDFKEWALKALDGTARGCVGRVRDIPVGQLIGLEQTFRSSGVLSRAEAVARIKTALANVPNPDPDKLAVVEKAFQV